MVTYTIYANPSDYPGLYVVRKWRIESHGLIAGELIHPPVKTLEAARACIPAGLCCIPRDAKDDPVVVEIWL